MICSAVSRRMSRFSCGKRASPDSRTKRRRFSRSLASPIWSRGKRNRRNTPNSHRRPLKNCSQALARQPRKKSPPHRNAMLEDNPTRRTMKATQSRLGSRGFYKMKYQSKGVTSLANNNTSVHPHRLRQYVMCKQGNWHHASWISSFQAVNQRNQRKPPIHRHDKRTCGKIVPYSG